jgi:hypothetical protein
MPDPDPFAWLLPRLSALVHEAEQAGIARDISVAVITDLINGPRFSPAPAGGVVDDENWNRDIGELDGSADARVDATIEIVDVALPTGQLATHIGHRLGMRGTHKQG